MYLLRERDMGSAFVVRPGFADQVDVPARGLLPGQRGLRAARRRLACAGRDSPAQEGKCQRPFSGTFR